MRYMRSLRLTASVAALLVATEAAASANVGVPMIFITLPRMVAALGPIILVETVLLMARLRTGISPSFQASLFANLASTFVGVPVAWAALVFLETLTQGGRLLGIDPGRQDLLVLLFQAPWLFPVTRDVYVVDYWMKPAASLVLLVPFFFASWLTERKVARWVLPNIEPGALSRAVLLGNVVSYTGLAIWLLQWLWASLR